MLARHDPAKAKLEHGSIPQAQDCPGKPALVQSSSNAQLYEIDRLQVCPVAWPGLLVKPPLPGHTEFKQRIEVRQSLGATASCLQTSGREGGAAEQRRALHARIGGNS